MFICEQNLAIKNPLVNKIKTPGLRTKSVDGPKEAGKVGG